MTNSELARSYLEKASKQRRVLDLGNLNAKRDWGHARDYVVMQWLLLQQQAPEDFVIATGVQHSVRDFVSSEGASVDANH